MKLNITKYICYNAIIACVYLALVYIFQFMSFGAIQFRIAEAMTILPSLFPFSVAGLTIGCFLSNFMSVWGWSDLVFGTLCTLVAGLITSKIKNPFLAALPPVLINSFGLPLVWLLLGGERVYWINVLWMLLGQTVVLYAVGVPVYYLAKRNLSALIQPEKDKKEE